MYSPKTSRRCRSPACTSRRTRPHRLRSEVGVVFGAPPGRGRCLRVAVRDGDFVELDQAYGSAGVQRGDGGYEGVDVWQLCVTRVTAVLDMVVIPVLSAVG